MNKFVTLLKYLDQSKITPEAVLEIAALMGKSPTLDQAAEVANAFRTRGVAGLMPHLLTMTQWPQKESATAQEPDLVVCRNCGAIMEIDHG
jgi:hypothetical protein